MIFSNSIKIPNKYNHPDVGDNLTKYYHLPLIRYFFLRRLMLALDFLDGRRFDRILEIGFGSGVFLLELSGRANRLFGLDIHESVGRVMNMLRNERVEAYLVRGDILYLPYKSESFDCIVSVATLEHIKNLSLAVSEIKRVLRNDGTAILGFPVANKICDLLLILTGSECAYNKKIAEIHPSTHKDILLEVKKHFGNIRVKIFPFFLPLDFSLYCSCVSVKNDGCAID